MSDMQVRQLHSDMDTTTEQLATSSAREADHAASAAAAKAELSTMQTRLDELASHLNAVQASAKGV